MSGRIEQAVQAIAVTGNMTLWRLDSLAVACLLLALTPLAGALEHVR